MTRKSLKHNELEIVSNHPNTFRLFADGKSAVKDAHGSKLIASKGPTGNVYIKDHKQKATCVTPVHKPV